MDRSLDIQLAETLRVYLASGIEDQVDYQKFYLYSIVTHSTAIEGSTVTEIENQLLFDEGIAAKGRTLMEQMMNVDLKDAYQQAFKLSAGKIKYTSKLLQDLSALVMRRTGSVYNTIGGTFDSSKGEYRKCNVSAGFGGRSYLSYNKVEKAVDEFCKWLNEAIGDVAEADVAQKYRLSFEAHFRLVTIHPWVDGNGRTSRMVMNMVQRQLGLVPTIVTKEHKAEYIQSLVDSREYDDSTIAQDMMLKHHVENLRRRILQYQGCDTANDTNDKVSDTVNYRVLVGNVKSVFDAIRTNPDYTYEQYARMLQLGRATIARAIRQLQADGYITRQGSDKKGKWIVSYL